MKIAIAQLNPTVGDLVGNSELILKAAQGAVEADCQLMLTTELALIGYPPRDLLSYLSFIEATAIQLHQLAQQLPCDLAVLVGVIQPNSKAAIQQGEKSLFNSAALVQQGQVQGFFQKRLLPTYDVFDEDRYFEPGKTRNDFSLKLASGFKVKVGVTICEDLWNDEAFWGKRRYPCNPLQDLSDQEVNLIVNLSASPYQVNKQKLRQQMLTSSARRYQLPILYSNQVGGNDDLIFDGGSLGINRAGNVITALQAFAPDFAVIEWDEVDQDLKPIDAEISPDISFPPHRSTPESEDHEIWLALVLGVQDYVRKCGFSRVILGLSGGVDSSFVAAIAAAAIGAENVLGILMPSPYSSDHSIKDAQDLANNLGIQTQILSIGDSMDTFEQTLLPLFAGTESGVAEENIQSRIRGTLLMAISNKFGHLLLSTGNKSEMAVGYCTLYGDMNGGLAVIADVPKTRVYSICHWLNRSQHRPLIPENVLTKPASAELKPGQVDQDSLPPYEVLDDILYRLVEQHQSMAEILAAGHEPETVDQVMKLVMRAEFKRRQAPPGLKISDRAFGTGWRMPIAKQVTLSSSKT
ncbi:MAG: NAD+ synthase [Oscillatoriales cyanobacterium RM2_1_1]|nr:NAD+ synthase [Oscillatoriales cyanobacterium RM2_1_1]